MSLPGWSRPLLALASGAAVGLGFAPTSCWWLAILGLAAVCLLVRGHTHRSALGLGYLFGLGLCGVAIHWLYGLAVWVAALLVAVVALFWMIWVWAASRVQTLPWWPVWASGAWLLMEFITARWPFGGFAWIRLGYLTVDTPAAGLLRLGGVPLAGFALVLAATGLASGIADRGATWRRWMSAVLAVVLWLGGGVSLWVGPPRVEGSVVVGLVQGNVNGVDPLRPFGRARTVTNNHLSETVTLRAKVDAGELPDPEFIVWPENSTDIDPLADADTNAIINDAVRIARVPILVGSVMDGPGPGERQTAGLWWTPDKGVTHRYHKRNLVPFGEWIPFRAQLLPLIPLLERAGAESIPGTEVGAWPVDLRSGRITVGDAICFELAWDSTVGDAARAGAQLLLVQSNNASYGGSAQIWQQWAMTRARAMETGRDMVVATTNSLSGIIRADGSVEWMSQEFVSASHSAPIGLRTEQTPAMALGPWAEIVLAGTGLAGVALALLGRRGRLAGTPLVKEDRS